MINLRYHIISITAVFLALGIGLTLGSTFLDRVTVDNLKNQLDEVQAAVEDTQAENDRLKTAVDASADLEQEMSAELAERAFAGTLSDVPVLVIATEGTETALVDQTTQMLAGADADLAGTWWLTERWTLDDDDELTDLGGALELTTQDAERLRRNGAIHLADVLLAAAQPPTEVTEPAVATQPAPAVEPELAARLEALGFLDYTAPAGAPDDRVLLPATGLRVVVVSSTEPGAGPELMSVAVIDEVTADGPAPLVVAQGAVSIDTEDGEPAPETDQRTTFVGPLRTGELTRDRLTTIDSLDTTAGLIALVLAVDDAGELRLGHYGVATGAARLLPGTDPDT